MSDDREVEVIVIAVNKLDNPLTEEEKNKMVATRRSYMISDRTSVNTLADKVMGWLDIYEGHQ